MIDLNNEYCTGCGACIVACPQKCISFNRTEEGFDIPAIELDKCIHCNKCETVCSVKVAEIVGVSDENQEAVAAITKSDDVWKTSTSGGAFTEICRAVNTLAKDTEIVFCGALFDGLQVKHKCVYSLEDTFKFRKSKYVQSSTEDCFIEIQDVLRRGGYAVFSGTPCQVYGLRQFLGKSYDNLYCIDLICHGVGSPGVFEKCMDYAEVQYGKKIKQYVFRLKNSGFIPKNRYTSLYIFEDDSKQEKTYDDYNRLFLSQVCLRSSCGSNCHFRNQDRQGDFTIADFNEKMIAFPDLKDARGFSTIVFNNTKAKGVRVLLEETMDLYSCDIEHIKKYNPLFYKSTSGVVKREDFFEEFCNGEAISLLSEKYGAKPSKGIRVIINAIPYNFKRTLYKILGKI